MPQLRADELTYYDELGIPRKASPDEVRDAFRALVRLIHPDHQTDEQLKAVAELQMRKLNRIYSVLSDPQRRRAYDDSLDAEPGPPQPLLSEKLSNFRSSRLAGQLAWSGVVIVAVALLAWLATDGPPVVATGNGEKPGSTAPGSNEAGARVPDIATELARARADLRIALFERDAAIHELGKLRGQGGASSSSVISDARKLEPAQPNPIGTMTELPSAPSPLPTSSLTANLPPPGQFARVPPRALSGFWFYLRIPEDKKTPALYPPEFIEATISEQNGQVKGRYRSRYRIVDRAISPDVNFEFAGKLAGNVVAASWKGPGGARGDLTIRLLSENSLRVEWTTDQLGSTQGLTAGTASLTRRLD